MKCVCNNPTQLQTCPEVQTFSEGPACESTNVWVSCSKHFPELFLKAPPVKKQKNVQMSQCENTVRKISRRFLASRCVDHVSNTRWTWNWAFSIFQVLLWTHTISCCFLHMWKTNSGSYFPDIFPKFPSENVSRVEDCFSWSRLGGDELAVLLMDEAGALMPGSSWAFSHLAPNIIHFLTDSHDNNPPHEGTHLSEGSPDSELWAKHRAESGPLTNLTSDRMNLTFQKVEFIMKRVLSYW